MSDLLEAVVALAAPSPGWPACREDKSDKPANRPLPRKNAGEERALARRIIPSMVSIRKTRSRLFFLARATTVRRAPTYARESNPPAHTLTRPCLFMIERTKP